MVIALLLLACAREPALVVVVGGGPAGLAAATEAASAAAASGEQPAPRVVLLEASDHFGGAALYGRAITALPEPGRMGPWADTEAPGAEARQRYVERVRPDVVQWLEKRGLRWVPARNPVDEVPLVQPDSGGPGLVGALSAAARGAGVDLRVGARVTALAREGERLRLAFEDHDPVRADAVIVATGGFMGSLEAARRELGLPEAPLLRGAPTHADGNGLALGEALGGAVRRPGAGVLYAHGTPSLDEPDTAWMLLRADEVFPVDAAGQWLPEARSPRGDSGMALLARAPGLPGAGTGWAVIDRRQREMGAVTAWEHRKTVPLAKLFARTGLDAPTLEALAEKLDLPAEALRAGLAEGEPTDARPLREGPYGAVALRPTTAKSLTGLETDALGRVLGGDGRPVPGLYAAGEVAGFGHPYGSAAALAPFDSTMVAGAVLTGRVAGRAAVQDLSR